MNSVNDIFVGFGGTGAFAKAMGLGLSTASEMRRRKSIPVYYWPKLVEKAREMRIKGVNNDSLVVIHAGRHERAGR